MRRPAPSDGVAWLATAAMLCAASAGVALLDGPRGSLDWRPGLGWHQAWRWWTAAWVHWSGRHLAVNLAGAAAVGWVGWRARAPRGAALAWLLSWPLTQALLELPDPARLARSMGHYGGLSGVLHAGVVVIGLTLLRRPAPEEARRHRLIGAALLLGTCAKVLRESPWDFSLRPDAMLGIAAAPLAHASGIAAGAVAWLAVEAATGRAPRPLNDAGA